MPSKVNDIVNAATIALWGFGREGRATFDFLKNLGTRAEITIVADDPPIDTPPGVPVLSGDVGITAIAEGRFECIVKSPGISRYRPEAISATHAGSTLTSATNLWLEANTNANVLAVTGTKGKSTTAKLIEHLARGLGIDAELAGNFGRPLMEITTPPELLVLELSSYQIADLEIAPQAVVILNLYPEHLPWHGSEETYFSDKLRILDLDPAPKAVINRADENLNARLIERAGLNWFNDDAGIRAAPDGIYMNDARILDADASPLLGQHNLSNLAAALAALQMTGVDVRAQIKRIAAALSKFKPLPHRLQVLGELSGVVYVNDSISTTPQSALAALQAFADQPKVLILGGDDRGLDFAPLISRLDQHNIIEVLTIPDNGPTIAAATRQAAPEIKVSVCESLKAATERAQEIASAGSVVLLSPAAPSFGHFRDYAQRGEAFASTLGFKTE
ncbi:MAG: UDP-N-acetylmuramoyl-L-alanine--D-glutamate ligase [Rhodospirillaceae bacterium]|nr:UDP-N-acetylmuramoyl-L-alanine--D-glutamate ligase [Rhodospirillaceae bacterium]